MAKTAKDIQKEFDGAGIDISEGEKNEKSIARYIAAAKAFYLLESGVKPEDISKKIEALRGTPAEKKLEQELKEKIDHPNEDSKAEIKSASDAYTKASPAKKPKPKAEASTHDDDKKPAAVAATAPAAAAPADAAPAAAATTPAAAAPAKKADAPEDAGITGMFDPSKGIDGMKEVFKMLMGLFQGLFTGNFDKMGDMLGGKGTEDKAAAEAANKTKTELADAEKRQAAAKAELSEISGKLAEIEAGKVASTTATTEAKKDSAPAPTPPSDGKTLSDKALKEKLDNLGYNQAGIDKVMADPTAKSTLAKDLATPGLSDNAAIEKVGVAMDNIKNKDAAVTMAAAIVTPSTLVSKYAGTSIAAHDESTKPSHDTHAPAPKMGPITKISQVSAPSA